nr:DUF4031 domain-containing protein [Sulfitobacter sp. M220]
MDVISDADLCDNATNPYGRMLMCHMVADTIGELLEMADEIKIARRHFQPWPHPHFDLSQTYRAKAIPVESRGLFRVMRAQKARNKVDPAERTAYEIAMQASTRGRRAMQSKSP